MPETPSFTFGIEEEYHLVDRESRELANAPEDLVAACRDALGERVAKEFLKSQIEIGTKPHTRVADAHDELAELRTRISELAQPYGLAISASSTQPLSRRQETSQQDGERYDALADDLAGVGRRLVVCGMHVHLGIEDKSLRIDLMNQARYFVPHLLTLTTSSPFWEQEDTGLKSFRSVIMDGLPRTGLPNHFESWAAYERTIAVMIDCGVIEDASKIWWDLRPSTKYPTLEMRAMDVCTKLDDAITVAALYVCLARMLYRLREQNLSWRTYPAFLINENRWRAQRYGVEGSLFDFGRGALVPYVDLVDEILTLIAEDAEALGCRDEVERARRIVADGTSADRQVRAYKTRRAEGGDHRASLEAAADCALVETLSF
ncbi:MAG: carboxylate-amine ligase [Pseudomonadota bacterium]